MMQSNPCPKLCDADNRLSQLNDALELGEPAKIAMAIFDLDQSSAATKILGLHGTNPGLWDILSILKTAGIRLRAE